TRAIALWGKIPPELVGGRAGWPLGNIATVYAAMGESDLALAWYKRALAHYEKDSFLREQYRGVGAINAAIGNLKARADDWAGALTHYQKAVDSLKIYDGPTYWGRHYARLGEAYAATGAPALAEATILEGVRIWREAGDPWMQAGALTALGRFYLQQGAFAQASASLHEALDLQTTISDRRGQAETLYQLARGEFARREFTGAIDYAARAIGLVEEVRSGLTDMEMRMAFQATVQEYYALQLESLMRMHGQRPEAGHDRAALLVSERARARSLLDLLSEARTDIRGGVDPALLARERDLQQTLTEKSAFLTQQLRKPETAARAETIRGELTLVRAEYAQTLARIRGASPRYAALTQPQPPGLADIQRELDPETLLLEYALGETRSYLWAVSRDAMQSYELPGRSTIEQAARRVYEFLTAHNQRPENETPAARAARLSRADRDYWQAAAELSHMLLGPAADQLQNRRLLIVADGALHYIPFAALPAPAPRHTTGSAKSPALAPLMAAHEIISLPSATTLGILRGEMPERKPAPNAAAIFADPVFDADDPRVTGRNHDPVMEKAASRSGSAALPASVAQALRSAGIAGGEGRIARLLFTRREAEAISRSLPQATNLKALDFSASRRNALGAGLDAYRILHFATHGLIDNDHPELSGVILSLVDEQGRSQDGYLRLQDIYNLRLNADLVVISACQTALGKNVRGEGLISLARGFLYAGAERVVSTLWKVDDRATAEFMTHLYQNLADPRRQSAAAALRAAQLTLLKSPRWKSPRYWAAFSVQGEWR
ncbi:MAG: CHAT domain-containing protein, partial [Blastocatellia bacterium]